MMSILRVIWRLPTLAFLFFGCAIAAVLIGPLAYFAPKLKLRLRNGILETWGRTFCSTLGVSITTIGQPPASHYILVSNHVSYVDIPLIASQAKTTFVAKAELKGWPLLGLAFRVGDTIFINRARKRDLLRVMEQIEDRLQKGLGVVIFPEGTSGRGDCILPLKGSLLELAVRQGQPVHWATLSYKSPPGAPPTDEVICWWGDAPFLPHFLKLLSLPGFEATLEFGDEPIAAETRKELADLLEEAMLERFRPMVEPG